MKRISLTICILLAACIAVSAQQAQSQRPTSAETRQTATQFLGQTKTSSDQFKETQADLNARNVSNHDTATFNKLKADIERLESQINTEQGRIRASLDADAKVSPDLFQRVDRLINQHDAKVRELEAFTKLP